MAKSGPHIPLTSSGSLSHSTPGWQKKSLAGSVYTQISSAEPVSPNSLELNSLN